MKKKMLALMLMLLAALSALTAAAEEASPDVGEIISGFKVTQLLCAGRAGRHGRPHGARKDGGAADLSGERRRKPHVLYRLPHEIRHDKGVPHVFEHACLSGSEKYPDPSLFFAMMNQTYNTFMNAMTATDYTIYPESSLSEDQLCVRGLRAFRRAASAGGER
ncbi:MAG: hypothetical protein ACLUN5_02490 [Oscillospiraceae bacterium]